MDNAVMLIAFISLSLGVILTSVTMYIVYAKHQFTKQKEEMIKICDQIQKLVSEHGGFHDSWGNYSRNSGLRKEIDIIQNKFDNLIRNLKNSIRQKV